MNNHFCSLGSKLASGIPDTASQPEDFMGIWCFPGVGPYHTFLGSTVGFFYEPLGPTVGQLQLSLPLPLPASPPKKTVRQMLGGEGHD